MDTVLGLSVTPSSVGLVLVEGQDADGVAVDGERFELPRRGSAGAVATSEQAAAAVVRTEALAADRGQRVQSIGVTWSDDADTEASLLLKSLSASGYDNIVPVRLSEATDALARGIADVMGYRTTAVCVIEPEQLMALVVATDEGAVQTAVNHSVVTEEDLIGWLSAVFTRADWEPEALVLVGSGEDLDGLAPLLEEALSVPVFSPAEAQLALARGAALACAQTGEFDPWTADAGPPETGPSAGRRFDRLLRVGPAALLVAGVVAFVASVSAALGLLFVPDRPAPVVRSSADTSVPVPAAVPAQPPVPVPAAPMPDAGAADVPEVAPEPEPAEQAPEPAPVPDAPPAADVSPAADVAPPPVDVPPPVPPAAATVPPVPQERPGLLQRIRDRLSGMHDNPAPPVGPAPAPAMLPSQ
ncbi:hypothetical protein Mycch_2861 [Mycolicibacterium chubuense NBB4]|uniref:DUF7159 domain-containing protein n=1 Tax=Mycolicibacterium chubuense (strain NBB4) TaxID=710421 RepID=I4BK15_MYCCN|nr:hypothetical protein [Mycolicibacterium chubuense]AFM17622.1 hypothetical protein Mycch_2861 [Mycolicibacterium chubuense NBB4]